MERNGHATPNGGGCEETFDAIIIGAGFGGLYLLHSFRKLGYKVKVLEAGKDLGGVWWWNSYPGARVDTCWPFYEFSAKELYEDWTWGERFPGRDELCRYFEHVENKWNLKKDIKFDHFVTRAEFNENDDTWTVYTDKDYVAKARYLLPCTGFAAKPYTPKINGLQTFKGIVHHTAKWPTEGVDVQGKRVGVIGTGASGVQTIQEVAPVVGHLTVFQRTANHALPMRQECYDAAGRQQQEDAKKDYEDILQRSKNTFAGWDYDQLPRAAAEDTLEQRTALWESNWKLGGFRPWLGNYKDLLTNSELNRAMYDFWRDKVRERLVGLDPELIENLAPMEPEDPFGSKRPSLEQNYYELYHQPNVKLYNVKKNPIAEVTPSGVRMSSGEEIDLDVLVLATGFDAVTGSLLQIDIRGINNITLTDKWANGAFTNLGMATSGFPNMFFMYGPQGPTAFAIGPRISEIQGDWIVSCLEDMKRSGKSRIDALADSEAVWRKETNDHINATVIANSSSWYMGANIPGKPREALNYMGGLALYQKKLRNCVDNTYQGFTLK